MIHELRVLHCVPGRLPALLRRFETDTLRLFEKHGIKQLGFWTVAIGESSNDLFLILEWESLAEREQKFGAFLKDPEWLEARRKSKRGSIRPPRMVYLRQTAPFLTRLHSVTVDW
jgi:NIPSNAP